MLHMALFKGTNPSRAFKLEMRGEQALTEGDGRSPIIDVMMVAKLRGVKL